MSKIQNGMIAPWWSSYNKAVSDGKVTKAEVKKLIEPFKSEFSSPIYRDALEKLADGTSKDAKATSYASKELNKLLHPEPPHIWFPGHDQLAKTYGNIAETALKDGTAKKLDSAPRDLKDAQVFDVTPKGLMGSKREVLDINGHLYLRTTPVVPNAKPTYYDVGPAPMF